MKRVLITLMIFASLTMVASGQSETPNLKQVEDEVIGAIRNRLDSVARKDLETWASLVADDMIAPFSGTKQSWLRIHKNWPPEVKYWYGPLENVTVSVHGDPAIVIYTARQYTEIAGQTTSANRWQIETHLRRQGRWLLAAVADAAIPPEPAAVKVRSSLLDSYAGQYEWAPTQVSTISREGDRLIERFSGEGKSELIPENETTFVYKGATAIGDSSQIIFVKDSSGRVTHYIYREYGATDRIVKKIK